MKREKDNKSLASLYPELSKEWHPNKNSNLTPYDVTPGSHKKVWWLLPYDDPKTGKHFDFEWPASIKNRVNGRDCPYLTGHSVWRGYNDLETTHPNLAREWHSEKNVGLKSSEVSAGSHRKVWWLLPFDDPNTGKHFDFEWQATIAHRSNGEGCPFLSGQSVWYGYNDLETTHPKLAKEWHPTKNIDLKPSEVSAGSRRKIWWLLHFDDSRTGKHFDFEWQASIAHRKNGQGCPYIEGRDVWPGYNDLETISPTLAKEWHPTKNGNKSPRDFTYGSEKKVWWLLHYIDPSTKKHFDFEWQERINNRVHGNGCPYLEGKKVYIGFNDLCTTNPELANEWHPTKNIPLTPYDITKSSNKNVWWLLPFDDPVTGKHFDFEWQAPISNRNAGNGCPYFNGKAIWIGYNDLNTTDPDLAKEWHPTKNSPLSPTQVTAGSNKKVWWYVSIINPKNGNLLSFEWKASVNHRSKGRGCPELSGHLQTSFPEQALYYYINKEYPDAVNGYTDIFKNGMELDIFIPSLGIGIEYDGSRWHRDDITFDRELRKYFICIENGIFLIRIKENKSHIDNDVCDVCLYTQKRLDLTILQLESYLNLPDSIDIKRDEEDIRKQYIIGI